MRIFDHQQASPQENPAQTPGFYLIAQQLLQPSEQGNTPIYFTPTALDTITKHSHYIGNLADFHCYSLMQLTARLSWKKLLLLCDKNKVTFDPAIRLRDRMSLNKTSNIRVVSAIHSTHYQGNNPDGKIKSHYKDVLLSRHKADRIVVLTQAQYMDIKERFPDEHIKVIPHALPQPCHIPHSKDIYSQEGPTPKANIAYIARLSPEKDHRLALDIFSNVISSVPEARLYLYGEGSERENIEQYIKHLKLEQSVFLEGYCSDTTRIYQDAQCAILTSKMEGFSLTLLEAMASRCPTVAFDINYGPSDLIINEKTGFLVPYGDKALFANCLINILTQPELAENLSQQALEQFSSRFSYGQVAKLWKGLLNDLFY